MFAIELSILETTPPLYSLELEVDGKDKRSFYNCYNPLLRSEALDISVSNFLKIPTVNSDVAAFIPGE